MPTDNGQSPKDLYLAYLQGEIDKLQALYAAVESGGDQLPGAPGATNEIRGRSQVDTQVRPDSFFGMTTPQAVRKFLEMMGKGNPQSPNAIADALMRGGQDKTKNVATVTKNVYTAFLRNKNDPFVKVGKLWGLVDWYGANAVANAASGDTDKRSKKAKGGKKAKAKKVAKVPARTATAAASKKGMRPGYNTFMSERRKAGKSMAEVAAEWRALKQKQGG